MKSETNHPVPIHRLARNLAVCGLLVVLAAEDHVSAALQTIWNDTLSVTYDDAAGSFAVAEKPGGKVFLTDGVLAGKAVKAEVAAASDPVFGAGRKIVVTQEDGVASLELYAKLPFVLVRTERLNTGKEVLDLRRVVPATFTLDLGKPAAELRTLGTGGLLAPDKNPGSYLFLACADPATRRGVVAGWLTHERGSGVVLSGVKDGKVGFKAQLDHGHLLVPAGATAKLETLVVGVFDDARLGEEQFGDALARQHRIKLRPQVAGHCTWYCGGASNETNIIKLAEVAAKELKPFGFSFVQIDDGWQDGGKFEGPTRGFDRVRPDGPYPHGMQPVAAKIKQLGLTAGIWFMPFSANFQDPEYQDRQHWFVKRPDGTPYSTYWGGTSFDLTHPEVQAYLTKLAQTIHSWGFDYFKMDGLYGGGALGQAYVNDGYGDDGIGNNAPFHDPSKTNLEMYRDGLRLLREAAGPDVFFSACNVAQNMRTLGGSIGLVDSMRIGPDNEAGWNGISTGPLRGSRLYFLNGRVWWNDPDPCYVRVEPKHAQFGPSWVALSGQFYLNSDSIPGLPADRLEIMKRTLSAHGATARPVDCFDAPLPFVWLVTDTRQPTRRDVLGLFNWEQAERTVRNTAAWAGLPKAQSYHAFDFWENKLVPRFAGVFQFKVPAQSCRVIAVRAAEGRPLVLSTSRHVTQGMIDLRDEIWEAATGTLAGTSQVIAGDPYELRIAGLTDGKQWKPACAELSAADQAAGVTVTQKEEPGLLRVTLNSAVSREVKWSLQFTAQPLPAGGTAAVTDIKASMEHADAPVVLSWNGSASSYEIRRDGSVIAAEHYDLTYADAEAPQGKTCTYAVKPLGGGTAATVTITTKPSDKPTAGLMTLTPLSATTGWGSVGIGKSANGGPLTLSGKVYPDGIGLHAKAEVVYACQPEWKRFVATAGIDDSQRADARASIVCQVIAEDAAGQQQPLAKSPVLQSGQQMQHAFDVPLPAGTAKLHLVVDDAGDGIACDHADWVNAGFRKE
ncbi:MAG: NPCBM/NEW2 domain-containing protein [Verrucomicrobia bacterium]|nr:NPCBM/NEW2 domain-containing protein [Verrucomicrobiota bacterium]